MSGMARPAFVYHPEYRADLGAHVFPAQKYAETYKALLADGTTRAEEWLEPEPASQEELALVHTAAYLDDFLNCRWTDRTASSELPLTREIMRAYVLSAGGTILASREALARGFGVHIGGGHHHAFADHAEGFCYVNDLAVAIRVLQREGKIRRAAVVDLDLHQGNGTAHLFQDDDSVFTFSMHQENLYPVKEEGDLDIGLDNGTADAPYLALLADALPLVFERAEPDLVLYQAGADPYMEDMLGSLNLSIEGLRARDRMVLSHCARLGIPCATTTGGGYARRVEDTITIHANTAREALAASEAAPAAAAARPATTADRPA